MARKVSYDQMARELHLTQPGISSHSMHVLKTETSCRLFDRLGKKQCFSTMMGGHRARNRLGDPWKCLRKRVEKYWLGQTNRHSEPNTAGRSG
jgi:hypothetical protein